jgi:hypothetical protein
MSFLYGLGVLVALIILWFAVRALRQRRRLKKYRASWEKRGTMLRIKRDRDLRARDPDLQTRPPTHKDGSSRR